MLSHNIRSTLGDPIAIYSTVTFELCQAYSKCLPVSEESNTDQEELLLTHTVSCVTEGRFHDRQLILQLVNYRLNLTAEFRFTRTYV